MNLYKNAKIKDEGKAVRYQVNKIFQQLNIEGEEPEEEDEL